MFDEARWKKEVGSVRPALGGWRSLSAARTSRIRPAVLCFLPFALLSLSGCAGFIDEITSRDFEFQSLFIKPNPLVVLRDSKDGDKRAAALRAFHEPSQHGGTREEQELVVTTLVTAAASEHSPVARLAAIQSLSRFKDPRAVEGLKAAYYAADSYRTESGEDVRYPTETASRIRCQALTALGDVGNPAAVEHLVTVVRQPGARGNEQEKQMVMDERIAAARALGRFGHYQATEALVEVLKNDKDVALRDRAHESLQAATRQKLPADYKTWDELLHREGSHEVLAAGEKPGPFQLLNFFQFKKE